MSKKITIQKLNNKGVTLIELIIAMTVSTIVIAMIIGFISAGTNSYSKANEEISLQVESQILLNQLEDIILESNGVEMQSVSDDVNAFIIYFKEDADILFHVKSVNKIYYLNDIEFSKLVDIESLSYTDENHLMARHVSEFSITKELTSSNRSSLTISVDFQLEDKVQTYTKQLTLRNNRKKPVIG